MHYSIFAANSFIELITYQVQLEKLTSKELLLIISLIFISELENSFMNNMS
jgi:uncharacterized membrane protein YoaT (DUF817 family)